MRIVSGRIQDLSSRRYGLSGNTSNGTPSTLSSSGKGESMILGKASAGILICSVTLALVGCASSADVADLKAQVDQNTLNIQKMGSGSAGGTSSHVNDQLADIETRLDQQKARLATLRGRLDVIDHRLDQLMEKIDTQDAQIKALNHASASAPAPASPAPPASGNVIAPPVPAPPPSASVQSPEILYRQAMNDYQKGHFDLSKKEFGDVVSQFPDSHLASSAQFWVGQSDFNMKNFSNAIDSYNRVITKYQDSPKRAIAYFKMARAYELLGKKKEAIHNYRRVLELFPLDRQLDELAKRRLSRLE